MLERWNPVLKAGTILLSVLLLSFQYLISLNLLVFFGSLLLLFFFSKAEKKKMLKLLIPAMIAAFGLFLTGLYYAKGGAISSESLSEISAGPYILQAALSKNIYTGLQLSTRLLAFAGMGILFALTTESSYFIASLLHQLKLSPKFAYGILAAFHLMPGMVREYKEVRIAYQVRGIKTHAWSMKPLFTMLVNAVRWSESLAMAMESKGFCGNAKRSYYFIPRVKIWDLLASLLMLGAIVLGMLFLPL